jgi:hypothetical protein
VQEAGTGGGRFLWGALTTFLAATSGAAIALVTADWAGFRDLPLLFAGTVPLALIVGLLSAVLGRQDLKLPNSARYALGLAIGAVFGFLWAAAMTLGLPSWFGVARLPVIPCWVGGGAAGLVSGLTQWPARGKIPELVVLCGLAVAGVACYEPVRQALSGDEQLTVVFVRWRPGAAIAPGAAASLSPAVRTALSAAGVEGRVELFGSAVHGHGKHSLAVIALSGPLPGHMTVAIPDADTIVFVQRASAFEMVPENSPTLDRTMDLYPDRRDSLRVQYQVRLADGTEEGGLAASWDSTAAPR